MKGNEDSNMVSKRHYGILGAIFMQMGSVKKLL